MRYLFIHPPGKEYENIHRRYESFSRALKQKYQSKAEIIDGKIFQKNENISGSIGSEADVIVINVSACQDSANMIQHWRAHDKIVIIDLSLPVILDQQSNTYQIGSVIINKDSGEQIVKVSVDRDNLIWILKLANGVITNSRQAIEDWYGIVKMFFVPDFLDLDKYLIHPFETHSGIKIGVKLSEGGINKLLETGLKEPIESIGNHHEQVKFVLFGEYPQFAHLLQIPPTQKRFIAPFEYVQWQSILPSLDIGILPKLNAYDIRCGREDVLELMVSKVPWIISDGLYCHELRQYGWLVQNKPGAWERILEDMIANLETYRNETDEAYLYVLGQGIDDNIELLVDICVSLKSEINTGD